MQRLASRITFLILLFMPIQIFAADNPHFFSGNDLYKKCQEDKEFTVAYVAGMIDMLASDKSVCLRKDVTVRQLSDMFCKELAGRPEVRDMPAADFAGISFMVDFPCPKKEGH